jgi:hypothetical protein
MPEYYDYILKIKIDLEDEDKEVIRQIVREEINNHLGSKNRLERRN